MNKSLKYYTYVKKYGVKLVALLAFLPLPAFPDYVVDGRSNISILNRSLSDFYITYKSHGHYVTSSRISSVLSGPPGGFDTTIIPACTQFLVSFDMSTYHSCHYLNNIGVPNTVFNKMRHAHRFPSDYMYAKSPPDVIRGAEIVLNAYTGEKGFTISGPYAKGIHYVRHYNTGPFSTCDDPVDIPTTSCTPPPPVNPPGITGSLSGDITFTTTAKSGSHIYVSASGAPQATNVMTPSTSNFYRIEQPNPYQKPASNILISHYNVTFNNDAHKAILKKYKYTCDVSITNHSNSNPTQEVTSLTKWDIDTPFSVSEHDVNTNDRKGNSTLNLICKSSNHHYLPLSLPGGLTIKYFNLDYLSISSRP